MLPADLADALRVLGPALAATAALFRALPALVTAARRRSASHNLPSPAILTDYSGVAPWARKTQWPQGWATDPEVRRQG